MDAIRFAGATTVDEVIRADAAFGRVFAAHGIDTCCGGNATLAEAAKRAGIGLEALLQALGAGQTAPTLESTCRPAAPHVHAPAPSESSHFTRFFIWSLIFALSFGATLGALLLGALTWPTWRFLGSVPLGPAKAAHAYAQVFGFATLFIMGVAYHTMPRFKGTSLADPGLASTSFWLQLGGVFLLAGGTLMGPPVSVLAWLAGTALLLCAALAFASIVHRTLAATPPLPEGFEPYLRAGCVWLVVAAALSVVSVAAAAGVGVEFLPAVWAAALWGFIGCWIFGMSLRVLPVFMGLPTPRKRRGLFVLYQGAVLLWVANAVLETWTQVPSLRAIAGAVLGLSVTVFVLRLGIFGPRQESAQAGARDYERFIVTAYLWLVAAVVFEPVWSAVTVVTGTAAPPVILDLGRHAFTLGFLTQMIIGVATRIVPVFTGNRLWSPMWSTATYGLLNAAVAVRALQAVSGLGGVVAVRPYVSLSGPLGLAAFAAFATNVFMTMRLRSQAAVTSVPAPATGEPTADALLGDLLTIPGALELLAESGLPRLRRAAAGAVLARTMTLRQACRLHGLAVEPVVEALAALPHRVGTEGGGESMNASSREVPAHPQLELAMPLRIEPIIVRDPFLEFLGLVRPQQPVAVTFEELVKAAGHLCPTVAGAYLILRHGLVALYGNDLPVRGEVRVTAYGRPQDFGYGPMAQLVNLVIGAAPETGFGGLGGGRFARRNLFLFKADDIRCNEFDFERLDNHRAVHVVYDPGSIAAPAALYSEIAAALAESATPQDVARFRTLWLRRVQDILSSDGDTVHITEAQRS